MIEKKCENVIKYYALCNKLKRLIRTGWKDWNVQADRIESVAEHIYGVQMLAIAMKSEFDYPNVNLSRVLYMLAVHELEEIIIGDLTLFQISKEEKEIVGHQAVERITQNLLKKDEIQSLIFEFDDRQTPDAKFAYFCDKLECDLQSKIYSEVDHIDLTADGQKHNLTFLDKEVQDLLAQGKTFGEMWIELGRKRYDYDENFTAVSHYAEDNNIQNLLK